MKDAESAFHIGLQNAGDNLQFLTNVCMHVEYFYTYTLFGEGSCIAFMCMLYSIAYTATRQDTTSVDMLLPGNSECVQTLPRRIEV